MSYSSNPLLPKARAAAVRLLVEQKLPLEVAARKSGIHRTTLWRWKRKWSALNENVQLENVNRPNRIAGSTFRLSACRWLIPTQSSQPHHFGRTVAAAVVDRIRYYRTKYRRCATIVHAYCTREGVNVSLSTVRRVLYRLGLVVRRKWRRGYRPAVPRPAPTTPGDLVQTDTVHLYDIRTKRRAYLYTLIDIYSRWAYAEYHTRLGQDVAAAVIRRGQAYAGFHFQTVQADNGPEYGNHFEQLLRTQGMTLRHSRVRRPTYKTQDLCNISAGVLYCIPKCTRSWL